MDRRLFGAGLLAALIVLVTAAWPATANFGSSGTSGTSGTANGVWLTNNNNFVVYKRVLTPTYAAGVDDAINNDFDTAPGFIASAHTQASCVEASADACVHDANYGDNGFNGWNACYGTTSGSHPDQVRSVTWVRINQYYGPPATRIACHELAHSIGLRHTSEQSSCVKQTSEGGTSKRLSNHDREHHIDLEY